MFLTQTKHLMGKAVVLMICWAIVGLGLYGFNQAISWDRATEASEDAFNFTVMVVAGGAAITLSLVVLVVIARLAVVGRREAKAAASRRASWKAKPMKLEAE